MKRSRPSVVSWATFVGLVALILAAAALSTFGSGSKSALLPASPTTTQISLPSACPAPPGSPSIELSDRLPTPTVTVSERSVLVVVVPEWHFGVATDVHIANTSVLGERCSVVLPDGGRRTILIAQSPGRSSLSATITPPTDAFMPAWLGKVVVNPVPARTSA